MVCNICGHEIKDNESTEYLIGGNHLSCELQNTDSKTL